jgi:hypothetical protein
MTYVATLGALTDELVTLLTSTSVKVSSYSVLNLECDGMAETFLSMLYQSLG